MRSEDPWYMIDFLFLGRSTMPTAGKVNLSGMNVQSLMNLRSQVDARLAKYRTELEQQLQELDRAVDGARIMRRQGVSKLKGRRVEPKYRSPSGETWAGRGQQPKWMVAAIKKGKKIF
jgi:DNA-binding protein H-NS